MIDFFTAQSRNNIIKKHYFCTQINNKLSAKMKKLLLLTALCTLFSNHLMAAESGWYLYVWSNTLNTGGDLGQFQTTDMEGVFTLQGVSAMPRGVHSTVGQKTRRAQ